MLAGDSAFLPKDAVFYGQTTQSGAFPNMQI